MDARKRAYAGNPEPPARIRDVWVPAFAGTNGCCTNFGSTTRKRTSKRDRRAHEIALAELDAAMAQDVVGGGAVEIEVRQRVGEQQRLAGELARRPARKRDLDRLVLAAVDLRGLQAFEEIDRPGDAILELGNGRLGVGEARQVRAGKPAAGVDGVL